MIRKPSSTKQVAAIPPELIASLAMNGPTPGSVDSLRRERDAADFSLSTGLYVTWRPFDIRHEATGVDCFRAGPSSRCFCNHSMSEHEISVRSTRCKTGACSCKAFSFVPSCPEEIGEWWLGRRPGFDAAAWRAKCRCKHTHEVHDPVSRRCLHCRCAVFSAAYACAACDRSGDEHHTVLETESERHATERPTGREFRPLYGAPRPVLELLLKDQAAVAQYDDDADEQPARGYASTAQSGAVAPIHTCRNCNRTFSSALSCQKHMGVCASVFGVGAAVPTRTPKDSGRR